MSRSGITRREFHLSLAAAGGALLLGRPGRAVAAPAAAGRSRVVLVRDPDVLDAEGRPRQAVLEKMLGEALVALTGKRTPRDAWRSLLRPADVVGIKSNVWQYIATTPQLEQAIRRGVLSAGVAEAAIGIDDRGVLANPIFQRATALINVRPMRSHHWAGVGSLIKNYITFVEDRPSYHPDACADLAKIWFLPLVKGKTRLNVLSLLTPQFHGVGPHSFNPKYVWRYRGLLVGFDPVAVDATGLRILEAKRRLYFGDYRPLTTSAKHIQLADTRWHLGTADPARIDVVRIGDARDALI